MKPAHLLLLGIGHPLRHDDAVGLLLAQACQDLQPSNAQIATCEGDGTDLIQLWKGHTHVLLLDAVCSSHPPGTIHRFDPHAQPLPADFFRTSTHHWGLAEAIELSRALGSLPPHINILGIEGQNFQPGEGLSPNVHDAMQALLKELCDAWLEIPQHPNLDNLPSPPLQKNTQPPNPDGGPSMHEMTLLAGLMKQIERIAKEQNATNVTTVRVKLGALSHISPDHFREHFVHAARNTPAQDATLEVEQLTDTQDPNAQEILLESIDVETPDT